MNKIKNVTKIYSYKIKKDREEDYLNMQSLVLAHYRKYVEVTILFLKDEKEPEKKKEIVRFFNVEESDLIALEKDPYIKKLFQEFKTNILDEYDSSITEESFQESSQSYGGLVNHIEIYCSKLEKSKDFWSWFLFFLGYKIFQEWDSGISYKLGETYIVLVQVEEKYLPYSYHRKAPGLNHLAFYAQNKKQVDDLVQILKAKSIPQLYPEKFPHAGGNNTYGVFFEDPERIKIELVVNI